MYIVSPITVFDEDKELWETYVGFDSDSKPILFSCWDKSQVLSRVRAEDLAFILNKKF